LCDIGRRRRVDIGDDDMRAGGSKTLGDCGTDTAPGAGDDRNASCERHQLASVPSMLSSGCESMTPLVTTRSISFDEP
jgi:hypothetical protein